MKATNFLVKWMLKEHSSYLQCIAQIYSNITLGSSLTALDNNSFWASLSGDFAFGFQQIGGGGEQIWMADPADTESRQQTCCSFVRCELLSGRFMFALQTDGNLVMYTTDFPMDSANFAYWSTQAIGSGFQVIFNQSGHIYVVARKESILSDVLSNEVSMRDFYQRAILEYDGVFRQYVYPKTAGSRADTGSGACGFNSYCTQEDDKTLHCQCPPGYSFLDQQNEMKGCKQDFVPESCDEKSQKMGLFHLEEITNVDWPFYFWRKMLEEENPLTNGRFDPSSGRKALIKVRKENSTLQPRSEGLKKKDQSTLILTGSVLLGSSVS
ncbi:G-type lectin S-receptor-like serine/threonine-protein kinase LECRK1 [Vitis vinifera]|uniref:G-type lectin S-receptor-like serine/threonine-protein kinase LECRK1 n=1 Tax=Vitis vinifera TaxID=29760 RepID=A0A438JUV9_VITVI|nr:G-type lectin S-receptor-like serine/threonine-protein kinase LECRK1 [Vitis vinifera]